MGGGLGLPGAGIFLLGCIWLHLVAFCGLARLTGGGDFFSLVAFGCIFRLGWGGFACFWSHLVAFGCTWRLGGGASFDKLRMIGLVRDGWAGSVVRFVIVGKGFGGWQGGRVLNTVNRAAGMRGCKGKARCGALACRSGNCIRFPPRDAGRWRLGMPVLPGCLGGQREAGLGYGTASMVGRLPGGQRRFLGIGIRWFP